ncbi:MAG: carbon-nitrogen hydrolase family protein, partial [Fervidobacterium sp.]
NIKKAEEFVKKASSSRADIIVFPEDFITGPILRKKEFVDYDGKYVKYFQNLAKKHSIDIVPGSWIESENKKCEQSCWYNTTYYIDSSGKIKGKYRKINLWHPERKYLTSGNEICVINTKYGKIGLIICWDLAFPEIFRKMVMRGVDIVICPSYWCYEDAGIGIKYDNNSEINFVNSLCIARAFENEIVVVYCNAAGKFENNNFKSKLIGRSQITVPFKGPLIRLDHNNEEMFIQEVDTKILDDTEVAYRIRSDLKKRTLS